MVKELYDDVNERMTYFTVHGLMPALRHCNGGALEDVLNTNGCAYYQWSTCLIDVMKPKQIVELGGAMGVWSICALHYLPADSKLYSITLAEHGLEFSFIKDQYPNLIKVVGDDLDMSNWPKDLDFSKTDLIFFDSLHTAKQLQAEIDLYVPLLKKGTVMLFDDIRMPELWPVWERLINSGKVSSYYEATNPLHYSGFGIAIL